MTKSTETSSFGVSARIGHDSSKFYNSKLKRHYEIINLQFDRSFEPNICHKSLY